MAYKFQKLFLPRSWDVFENSSSDLYETQQTQTLYPLPKTYFKNAGLYCESDPSSNFLTRNPEKSREKAIHFPSGKSSHCSSYPSVSYPCDFWPALFPSSFSKSPPGDPNKTLPLISLLTPPLQFINLHARSHPYFFMTLSRNKNRLNASLRPHEICCSKIVPPPPKLNLQFNPIGQFIGKKFSHYTSIV